MSNPKIVDHLSGPLVLGACMLCNCRVASEPPARKVASSRAVCRCCLEAFGSIQEQHDEVDLPILHAAIRLFARGITAADFRHRPADAEPTEPTAFATTKIAELYSTIRGDRRKLGRDNEPTRVPSPNAENDNCDLVHDAAKVAALRHETLRSLRRCPGLTRTALREAARLAGLRFANSLHGRVVDQLIAEGLVEVANLGGRSEQHRAAKLRAATRSTRPKARVEVGNSEYRRAAKLWAATRLTRQETT